MAMRKAKEDQGRKEGCVGRAHGREGGEGSTEITPVLSFDVDEEVQGRSRKVQEGKKVQEGA
jgi:hypothetical protein